MASPVSVGSGTLGVQSGFTLGLDAGTQTIMTGLDGWYGSTKVRRDKAVRTSSHGSHGERGWKDERLVTLRGHFFGVSRGEAAREAERLAGFLGDGTEGILTIDDADLGPRWAEVYLVDDGVDCKWTGRSDFPFTIRMLAPDPRKYGTKLVSPTTGIQAPGGGMVFPLFGPPNTGKLDFGTGGSTGLVSLSNVGTAPAFPVYRVTATGTPNGFSVTETTTSRRVVYSGSVVAGQELVIVTGEGSATLNGEAPRENELVLAQFTPVPPGGSSSWLFEAPNSVNAQLTVEVVPAWW